MSDQLIIVEDQKLSPTLRDPNEQPQCQHCGLFMKAMKNEVLRPYPFGGEYPYKWKCVRMSYNSYYDAWEHD